MAARFSVLQIAQTTITELCCPDLPAAFHRRWPGGTGWASLTFTLDTTAPAAPPAPADSAVANGYVNAAHDTSAQALSGSAENGSTVTVSDNGTQVGTTTANAATGAWSVPLGALADAGTHSYTVTATDAAGNVNEPSAALSFVVDTDADEQALLKLAVTTTAISAATASSVSFTIAGLQSEDTGRLFHRCQPQNCRGQRHWRPDQLHGKSELAGQRDSHVIACGQRRYGGEYLYSGCRD